MGLYICLVIQRCLTVSVNVQEQEISSQSLSASTESLPSTSSSPATTRENTLMSSLMVPSRRVCPTNSTMERLDKSSMLPSTPLVLLSTSALEVDLCPREFTSELSTYASLNPVRLSDSVSKLTMPPREMLKQREPRSTARESPPSLAKHTQLKSPRPALNSLTPSSSESFTEELGSSHA